MYPGRYGHTFTLRGRADDESLQLIKASLVETLRVYLSPGHGEKTWRAPKEREPTEKLCRQVFSVEAEHAFPYDCVVHT